jgi:uncharacterized protein YbgA (DUF1722 family)/uncharacterized protein YbbK (DUF523 family)
VSDRTAFTRPRVVLSQCLELEPCRYDGQSIRARIVPLLMPHVDLLPVCPEVEIGLGVPRPPIRLVARGGSAAADTGTSGIGITDAAAGNGVPAAGEDGNAGTSIDGASPRLVQPATGRDVTDDMTRFAARHLASLRDIDGFLLKARSPSCGIKDVRIYGEDGGMPAGKGPGLFAAAVLERFPHAAIEDEGRLTNFRLRHHFLTRLYALAGLRTVAATGTMAALVAFHADHKMILLAHNESAMRVLGRLVANAERRPFADVVAAYHAAFAAALARPARMGPNINTLMHVQGHASEWLSPAEKSHFADVLEAYRKRRLPLSAPLTLARAWIARFDIEYLATQRFFAPYPELLLDLRDSGGDTMLE